MIFIHFMNSHKLYQQKYNIMNSETQLRRVRSQKVTQLPLVKSTRSKTHRSQVKLLSKESSKQLHKAASKSLSMINKKQKSSYEGFIKQMKIKLPTPKEKFLQFLLIPPFNRNSKHTQFIAHFLKKYNFFKIHSDSIIDNLAKKVFLVQKPNIDSKKMMIILEDGACTYLGQNAQIGQLISRYEVETRLIQTKTDCNFIGIFWHDYRISLSTYLSSNRQIYEKFLASIQLFKIFSTAAFEKILSTMTLSFYNKGQTLFKQGDEANQLLVVYRGRVCRKVIVQIDKMNKIILKNFEKLLKIYRRSYEHKVQFEKEDLIGVADILEQRFIRKEKLIVEEDCQIIGLDRNAIQENLDEYLIDRLTQYNDKKYPKSYDNLCENYLNQKRQARKSEQRKICALKDGIYSNCSAQRQKKIQSIIKLYKQKIAVQENKNLLECQKSQRRVREQ